MDAPDDLAETERAFLLYLARRKMAGGVVLALIGVAYLAFKFAVGGLSGVWPGVAVGVAGFVLLFNGFNDHSRLKRVPSNML